MRIFSSEPLQFIKNRLRRPLQGDYLEESQYDENWLLGDDPEQDLNSLIKQKRIVNRD